MSALKAKTGLAGERLEFQPSARNMKDVPSMSIQAIVSPGGESITVLKGSIGIFRNTGNIDHRSAVKRDELIAEKKVHYDPACNSIYFLSDVTFDNRTQATEFVSGGRSSSGGRWKVTTYGEFFDQTLIDRFK